VPYADSAISRWRRPDDFAIILEGVPWAARANPRAAATATLGKEPCACSSIVSSRSRTSRRAANWHVEAVPEAVLAVVKGTDLGTR
jgi:hypothetical protein